MAVLFDVEPRVLELLIDSGAKVNGVKEDSFPRPLYAAFFVDKLNLAKVLIDSGADINRREEYKGRFYDIVAAIILSEDSRDDIDSVELLLEKGFKVYADNSYLEIAGQQKKIELSEYFKKMIEEHGLQEEM